MGSLLFQTLYTGAVREGKKAEEPIGSAVLREGILQLEDALCEYTGAACCVAVSNATTGLCMALRAAGVKEGDAVLYTPFGFFAVQEVLQMLGAEPMPVDINPGTWNMDCHCLEYALKRRARERKAMPKALIATDLFGLPCDFDAIGALCKEYNITLIEDMAQAFGAEYHGVKTGNFGRFSVASFFPGHSLGESDGGAVFCRNVRDMAVLKAMRSEYQKGGNLCVENVEAAVMKESLREHNNKCARRQGIAARYAKNLDGIVRIQQAEEGVVGACSLYGVLLRDRHARDMILEGLWEREIPCNRYMPSSPCGGEKAIDRIMLRNARSFAERMITLPMHAYLSARIVEHVSACIAELVWKYDEKWGDTAESPKSCEKVAL